jgi:hypothetical protein
LDDLGLVSTGKPAGSQVKPAMGMGAGMAKNTWGLPVQFTKPEWFDELSGVFVNICSRLLFVEHLCQCKTNAKQIVFGYIKHQYIHLLIPSITYTILYNS